MNLPSAPPKRPERFSSSAPLFCALFILPMLALGACTIRIPKIESILPRQPTVFSAELFHRVLVDFVDENGRVDYPRLKTNRNGLDAYIGSISVVGPQSAPDLFPTEADRLAYYINAYNAYVLLHVIEIGPRIDSVGDTLLAQLNFFVLRFFRLDGRLTNLWTLENRLIRTEFSEPRVHFALNCASLGCPHLPGETFTGPLLQEQLERETQKFLSDKRNLSIQDQTITLSQIFEWFPEDFSPSVLDWLKKKKPDAAWPENGVIQYRPWDWTINARAEN